MNQDPQLPPTTPIPTPPVLPPQQPQVLAPPPPRPIAPTPQPLPQAPPAQPPVPPQAPIVPVVAPPAQPQVPPAPTTPAASPVMPPTLPVQPTQSTLPQPFAVPPVQAQQVPQPQQLQVPITPTTAPAAPSQKPKKPLRESLRGFLSFGAFLVSIILLALFINVFIFQSYYVDGTSMAPTLQPNDRLIINKMPKTWAAIKHQDLIPERGNIIVFNSPYIDENGRAEQLIKRVIGLPGERVVVQNGSITIYNQENPEGFDPDKALGLTLPVTDGNVDVVVPEGHVFVCGDNRERGMSLDSRSELGPIASKDIVGELTYRIYPLNQITRF